MVKLFRERVAGDGLTHHYEYDYDAEATRNVTFAEMVRRALTELCLHDPWKLRQYASLCDESGLDQAARLLRGMYEALQVVRLAEQQEASGGDYQAAAGVMKGAFDPKPEDVIRKIRDAE